MRKTHDSPRIFYAWSKQVYDIIRETTWLSAGQYEGEWDAILARVHGRVLIFKKEFVYNPFKYLAK